MTKSRDLFSDLSFKRKYATPISTEEVVIVSTASGRFYNLENCKGVFRTQGLVGQWAL